MLFIFSIMTLIILAGLLGGLIYVYISVLGAIQHYVKLAKPIINVTQQFELIKLIIIGLIFVVIYLFIYQLFATIAIKKAQ